MNDNGIKFKVVTPMYLPEVEYDNNPNFKAYVDRYSKMHKITPIEALNHEMVRQVYLLYKEDTSYGRKTTSSVCVPRSCDGI